MCLKDATAFNVQFLGDKAIFIDTLSFEKLDPNKPWKAYYQFCKHFVAPLTLSSYNQQNFNRLFLQFTDGIPLDYTKELLPFKSKLNYKTLLHLHLHQKVSNTQVSNKTSSATFNKKKHLQLVDNLTELITELEFKGNSNWKHYEEHHSKAYTNLKEETLLSFLTQIPKGNLLDLGANTGHFSRLSIEYSKNIVAAEADFESANQCYLSSNSQKLNTIVFDLVNPSPKLGWNNNETDTIYERMEFETLLCLALSHHLILTHNLSFEQVRDYFKEHTRYLAIEFVSKEDEMCQQLVRNKMVNFPPNYTQQNFEDSFSKAFTINEVKEISQGKRWLYLMKRKE